MSEQQNQKSVSVTWKWLAVTAVSLLIGLAGYDRAEFGAIVYQRLDKIEDRQEQQQVQLGVCPSKDDIKDLRSAIDKLSDKIEMVQQRAIPNHT